VVVIGASGCGKTSLLRIIAGLLEPSAGRVIVGDAPAQTSTDVAMVFQADTLLPWRTVAGNVRYGCEVQGKSLSADALEEGLKMVGLEGSGDRYPKQLSGGMRQRVNLLRALATDPTVLLMDEPFAALDAQTRQVMQQQLLEIWQRDQKTVVFVTHQIDEALFLADRVVVMAAHPGRIVSEYKVPFKRPRDLDLKYDPRFTEVVHELWGYIKSDAFAAVEGSYLPTGPAGADEKRS
jgi:NitT/TauT family transport system ATP-binding protein